MCIRDRLNINAVYGHSPHRLRYLSYNNTSNMFLVKAIFDIPYILVPSAGYYYQYKEIEEKGTSEGFSPLVCTFILVSMIARIFFWTLATAGVPVLLQALVLIASQARVKVSVGRIAVPVPEVYEAQNSFDVACQSPHEAQYLLSLLLVILLILYTFVLHLLTGSLKGNHTYAQLLGAFAALAEAFLAAPQFYRSFATKSTEGLSHKLVLLWTAGDFYKMVYNVVCDEPVQLVIAAGIQLLLDTLILLQTWIHAKEKSLRSKE
eukprot:TRINITY_DN8421_c0_g4_i1.p1 TRINITY_DN8421_c0_g4~~TRINITY_DN8421_c0_g4_i1.p1  ORF type:complete len:263 (-),score=32.12 TRINITY_DN8421_c0_g4_i1:91-879(-)